MTPEKEAAERIMKTLHDELTKEDLCDFEYRYGEKL
jgi:hypothetical protein